MNKIILDLFEEAIENPFSERKIITGNEFANIIIDVNISKNKQMDDALKQLEDW